MNGDGRVSAKRKESGGAEIHVAAIAAKNIPRGREHHILQHDVAGEEIVVVAERQRSSKDTAADDEANQQEQAGAHVQRPSRPAGRTASVSSRNPNDTAGAQDGP